MINMMSPQDALIAVMTLMSAADHDMKDSEIKEMSGSIELIPVFQRYDRDRISVISEMVIDLLQNEDGIETLIGLVKGALPDRLYETAYALACDVAAADGDIQYEEARLLEMVRHGLDIERLIAAGIERGARARHLRIEEDAPTAV